MRHDPLCCPPWSYGSDVTRCEGCQLIAKARADERARVETANRIAWDMVIEGRPIDADAYRRLSSPPAQADGHDALCRRDDRLPVGDCPDCTLIAAARATAPRVTYR